MRKYLEIKERSERSFYIQSFTFSLQSAWSAFWRDRKSDTIFVLIPIFGVGIWRLSFRAVEAGVRLCSNFLGLAQLDGDYLV